jgi:outer membrane protein TolC
MAFGMLSRFCRFEVSLRTIGACAMAAAMHLQGCAIKPKPAEPQDVALATGALIAKAEAAQPAVSGPISIREAMARALMYNLDGQVEAATAALRIKELELSHYSMLPGIVANSASNSRSNPNAARSVNVATGAESLAGSTSSDNRVSSGDIAISWNIIDFGLSYVRAQQIADQVLIAEETRRKVAARLVEDVRTAYWRAYTADRHLQRLRALESRSQQAERAAKSIASERRTSPLSALLYNRELLEIKRVMRDLERDLVVARTQLSSLMNLTPGTPFVLLDPSASMADYVPRGNPDDMVRTALRRRPELREAFYNKRINMKELDAAFLELLPNAQMFLGANQSSNSFLVNRNWVTWGAQASWNLMKMTQLPAKKEVIAAQDDVLDRRTMAVAMAIMTQVHVSRARYAQSLRELDTAQSYASVQRRISKHMRSEGEATRVSEQVLVREELNAIVAETRRDIARAQVENARANLISSMGLGPLHLDFKRKMSVKDLAASLEGAWKPDDPVTGQPAAAVKPPEQMAVKPPEAIAVKPPEPVAVKPPERKDTPERADKAAPPVFKPKFGDN